MNWEKLGHKLYQCACYVEIAAGLLFLYIAAAVIFSDEIHAGSIASKALSLMLLFCSLTCLVKGIFDSIKTTRI